MAIQKPTLPKGTRDFGPAEVQKRKYILNTIEMVFKKYGFMPLETPTMENLSTLEGKYGDEGDRLLFRVLDSGEYLNSIKQQILPKLTISVQNLVHDLFDNIIDQFTFYKTDQLNEISNRLKNEFEFVEKDRYAGLSQDQLKEISAFFLNDLAFISRRLEEMLRKSGLNNDSSDQERRIQMKNLRSNVLDFLTLEIVSRLSQVSIEFFLNLKTHSLSKIISEKGLRYDLTVPFARYVVMNRNNITFPFKRYQMQPVWRADKPQKGRYREFWQCDADVVGSDSLLNELDLIRIYDEAFRNLGVSYEIKINNRKILAGIAEVVKSVEYMNTIAVAIDKIDKIGEEGVRKELAEQHFDNEELDMLFSIITIKGDNISILNELKTKLANSAEGMKGIDELLFVFNALQQFNSSATNQINIITDFSLARGLSYYTGCIFEVVSTEGSLKSSIGGGGRYDNLTGIFGLPNVSGVGISFGLDRIYDVMDELKLFPAELERPNATKVLFCHIDEKTQLYCLPALNKLRNEGIASELYPDLTKKIGKQIEYATTLQIPFVAIVEQTEREQGLFKLRNMITRDQKICTIQELIDLVH